MKRKLYGNTITPACHLCANGRFSADGEVILCLLKGVTDPGDCCRKFNYDPLRRVPFRQPPLATFSEEDFRIDQLPE